MSEWFNVDKEGLAALIEKRGKAFAVLELVQNAWDQNVETVHVSLEKVPKSPMAIVTVEDDDPEGFSDLTHAFTLFRDTEKRYDPEKRGRFNFGEKLALALCTEATISTTKGTVYFGKDGRKLNKRKKRPSGSVFTGKMRMTCEEFDEVCEVIGDLIPPPGIITIFNGETLMHREPIATCEESLKTELADENGVMRTRHRTATIEAYESGSPDGGKIYEMGIPVVATGDRWHYNILQKIPLNIDRNNVDVYFTTEVRVAVVNEAYELLTIEDANSGWVKAAMEKYTISPDAVLRVTELRHGADAVVYDPNDPEANKIAQSKGMVVVYSSQHSGAEWDNIRKAKALLPAGQVTPSPRPYSDAPDAPATHRIPPEKWTPGMCRFVDYAKGLAERLLHVVDLDVTIVNTPNGFAAAYGSDGPFLHLNVRRLGHKFFNEGIGADHDKLLIHEFGHHYSGDHLSEDYHEALCKLGAGIKQIALDEPEFFRSFLFHVASVN